MRPKRERRPDKLTLYIYTYPPRYHSYGLVDFYMTSFYTCYASSRAAAFGSLEQALEFITTTGVAMSAEYRVAYRVSEGILPTTVKNISGLTPDVIMHLLLLA